MNIGREIAEMSIDCRLIDYWLHSRDFGYVDRIPTSESVMKPELPYPEPDTIPTGPGGGPRLNSDPDIVIFPIGDET